MNPFRVEDQTKLKWNKGNACPSFLQTAIVAAICTMFVLPGCGRRDLGAVTGVVLSDGKPRGFRVPESMRITFSNSDPKMPLGFLTPVRENGSFTVDMNDGTGRGVPAGTYVVEIDVNSLRMRPSGANTGSGKPVGGEGDADDYPQPSAAIISRLQKAKSSVTVTPGKSVRLVIDLDQGTITEAADR